jgi:hypothetical protein
MKDFLFKILFIASYILIPILFLGIGGLILNLIGKTSGYKKEWIFPFLIVLFIFSLGTGFLLCGIYLDNYIFLPTILTYFFGLYTAYMLFRK